MEFVNRCRPHLMHFEGTKEGSKSGNLITALRVLLYLTAQPRYTPRHCTHTRRHRTYQYVSSGVRVARPAAALLSRRLAI